MLKKQTLLISTFTLFYSVQAFSGFGDFIRGLGSRSHSRPTVDTTQSESKNRLIQQIQTIDTSIIQLAHEYLALLGVLSNRIGSDAIFRIRDSQETSLFNISEQELIRKLERRRNLSVEILFSLDQFSKESDENLPSELRVDAQRALETIGKSLNLEIVNFLMSIPATFLEGTATSDVADLFKYTRLNYLAENLKPDELKIYYDRLMKSHRTSSTYLTTSQQTAPLTTPNQDLPGTQLTRDALLAIVKELIQRINQDRIDSSSDLLTTPVSRDDQSKRKAFRPRAKGRLGRLVEDSRRLSAEVSAEYDSMSFAHLQKAYSFLAQKYPDAILGLKSELTKTIKKQSNPNFTEDLRGRVLADIEGRVRYAAELLEALESLS